MGATKTILVIDDELNLSKILEAKLKRSGFQVDLAHDAATGLRRLLTLHYDAVLLDIHLPDGAGLDLLVRFLAVSSTTPVILMTAYEETDLRERALVHGATEVLFKPFDLDLLVQTVRQQIQKSVTPSVERASRPNLLPTGHDVVVHLPNNGKHHEFVGRITERSDEFFAVISDNPVPSLKGESVSVTITGDDAEYRFKSKVVSTEQAGAILTLRKPAVITRNQRRKYPRVPLNLAVGIFLREADETRTLDLEGRPEIAGMARNVSMNGIEVALAQPIASNLPVIVSWTYRDDDVVSGSMAIHAKVVRCEGVSEQSGMPIYRAAIQFTRMSRQVRGRLRAYIDSRI